MKHFTGCLNLLLIFTMQSAFAQKGFRIGVAGGPQITGILGLPGRGEDTHGWNAGLCAGYNFTSHFGL